MLFACAPHRRRHYANRLAPWMFVASVVFLAMLATLIVITVDAASHPDSLELTYPRVYQFSSTMLLLWWPLFWCEALFNWLSRPWSVAYRGTHLKGLGYALIPPLRMCARNPDMGDRIWLPRLGWRRPDEYLRLHLAHRFSGPVLGIAVLILPVLGIDYFLKDQVLKYSWLQAALHFSTGLIWFAFTTEFIVMVSVAESKLEYCKKHWIDLAIILLPLVSFLRTLQLLRATRLAQIAKVPQLTKMARVYRLRGVSTKVLRAFVVLDLASRVLRRSPEKRLAQLHREHARLARDLREIEHRIDQLHQRHPEIPSRTSSDTHRVPARARTKSPSAKG